MISFLAEQRHEIKCGSPGDSRAPSPQVDAPGRVDEPVLEVADLVRAGGDAFIERSCVCGRPQAGRFRARQRTKVDAKSCLPTIEFAY